MLSERYLNRSFNWDVTYQLKKSKGESRKEACRSVLHHPSLVLFFVITIKQMTAGCAFGGEVSTQEFIEYVIFQSGGQHLESMKAAD